VKSVFCNSLDNSITRILILVFLNTSIVSPQPFTFDKHIIDTTVNGCAGIYSGDIDMDGDIDIAATSIKGNRVILWLNKISMNGTWKKIDVDTSFILPIYIYMSDINDDSKTDIVAGSGEGVLAWWEQVKVDCSVWTKHIIDTGYYSAHGVVASDINNDSHTDIIATSAVNHSIAWWENSGGSDPEWTKHIICDDFHVCQSCYVVDIDNDSDMDVIGAASGDNEISIWFNIDGKAGQWRKKVISDSFEMAHWVSASDIDVDGNIDILGAACAGCEIAWWKNPGNADKKWLKHSIGKNLDCALTVEAADINNDNCIDVISTAWMSDELAVWEQVWDTTQIWIKHAIDTSINGAWPLHTNDLDNDGDIDIIASGDILNRKDSNPSIYWWENKLTNSTEKRSHSSFWVYPIVLVLILVLLHFIRKRIQE